MYNSIARKRAEQAEEREKLAYELGQRLAALLHDVDALLAETVDRLRRTFGYYHAHVYLYEEPAKPSSPPGQRGLLIVYAGTGQVGEELKRSRHTIPLEARQSLVARAARSHYPVIVNNVRQHAGYLPNPLLPHTRSEAAIPLLSGGRLLGVLDLQHTKLAHFTTDEVRTLEIIGNVLSIALANARLFSENARRSAIIEHSSDLVALVDPEGFVVNYINPAGTYLLGYDRPGEVIGRSIENFHTPEDFRVIRDLGIAMAREHGVWRGENRLRRRDGALIPIEQTIFVIEDERSQLFAIATLISDITSRKQAEQALKQHNRTLDLLNRAGQVFISTLDLDQVLATIVEEVRLALDVIACSAWLIDPATGELVCRYVTDPQGERVRGWRLKPGQGLAGWAAQTGDSLIVPNAREDPRHFSGVDEETGLLLHSILTVPLKAREQVIGVLQVVDTEIDRFSSTDLSLLESLAATAAIAIENARLYEKAREDAETKSALLAEVNHRVKNNLAAIIGLLYAEQRHAGMENQAVYQSILDDLISRVQGLATVHSMLSASGWAPLSLSELAYQVIRSAIQALPRHQSITLDVPPSPVKVTPDQAHHLALVLNELATNTLQHAFDHCCEVRITVRITREEDTIQCEFRDDGPGYPEQLLHPDHAYHNVGFELIQDIVRRSLRGELRLYNDNGAVTAIRFKARKELTEREK